MLENARICGSFLMFRTYKNIPFSADTHTFIHTLKAGNRVNIGILRG